jgi:hypothetical protein
VRGAGVACVCISGVVVVGGEGGEGAGGGGSMRAGGVLGGEGGDEARARCECEESSQDRSSQNVCGSDPPQQATAAAGLPVRAEAQALGTFAGNFSSSSRRFSWTCAAAAKAAQCSQVPRPWRGAQAAKRTGTSGGLQRRPSWGCRRADGAGRACGTCVL